MPQPIEKGTTSGFLSDARVLEKFKAASSLPETPREPDPVPAPVEPTTLQELPTEQPPVETPVVPEAVSEEDFSTELPDIEAPVAEPVVEVELPADSPLTPDAPQWQRDAYTRLQSDPDISDEDKAEIAKQPPGLWAKLRTWNKSNKLLGKYRDRNVPIKDVVAMLAKQDPDRTNELISYAVSDVIDNPERSDKFATENPEVFSRLIVALATHNQEFLTQVMQRQGYKVVKAGPVDVDTLMAEFENDPMWEITKDTELGESIRAKFEELAGKTAALDADELASTLRADAPADNTVLMDQAAKVQDAYEKVRENVWLVAVADGLHAQGIRPATQTEIQKNPALANLKTIIYNVALRGLPGVIADWDEQSYAFGEKQEGFMSTAQELQSLISRGEIDAFVDGSTALSEFYYEFGKRRAGIGAIRNTYAAIQRLLGEAPPETAPPAPQTPEQVANGKGPVDQRQFKYGSDRIVLEKAGIVLDR